MRDVAVQQIGFGCKMLTLSARNRSKSKKFEIPKIDELLESIGLIRHVVPRDGNSLFRCISQCVFLTQTCYMAVRQHLLEFSNLQTKEFSEMTQLSISNYKKKITDTKLDGELLDMRIAAKLYKINILLFYANAHPFMPLVIETPNSIKTLHICLNNEDTYDLVFIKEFVVNISFCQAIIYRMLYNNVFKLRGIDFATREMLFGRKLLSTKSNDNLSLEKRAICTDMKELLEAGITPFPFKVAKALTPKLFRNTEYDIWLNNKKEKFYGRWNNWEFKEGSKCLVLIGNHEYHCYIQCITGKNEPVEVYVKELAQKMFVSFNQLKLISVEQEVKEIIRSPIQVSQVSSTTDDGNKSLCQVTKQCETPVQYSNSFIHRPGVHEVNTSQVFTSAQYIPPFEQQLMFSMASLNSMNNRDLILPWHMSTPPPILPNDFCPFKDQIVFLEPSSSLSKNCVPQINLPPPNIIDTSSNISEMHVKPMLPPWYCNQQSNISCGCMQFNNGEESGMGMDSNHIYQPWLVPEFDVPTNCSNE